MQSTLHCHHVETLRVLASSFVRICDEGDEALQPEWEIDPKDLQLMEKVPYPGSPVVPVSSVCCVFGAAGSVQMPQAPPCVSS